MCNSTNNYKIVRIFIFMYTTNGGQGSAKISVSKNMDLEYLVVLQISVDLNIFFTHTKLVASSFTNVFIGYTGEIVL
jgi:hypothetical protein